MNSGDNGWQLNPPEEAARKLAISRATLYTLLAAGEIESVKIGKSRRIPDSALAAYVARLRGEQADDPKPAA